MITFIGIVFLLLWVFGLGWSVQDYYAGKPDKPLGNYPAPTKTVIPKKKGLIIVALGDSLTRGTGDETGKGYVGDVIDEVRKHTTNPVQLINLGIIGQQSNQLLLQVKQKEVKQQISQADYVFITIGGNDLFRGGQGIMDYSPKTIAMVEKKYINNIGAILKEVRLENKNATVFMIGLYNPFINLKEGKETSKIIRQWNYQSAEKCAEFPKVVYIPTFDLFELKVNDYLYSDKFHPNTKGYRLIAERIVSLMTW